MIKGLGGHGSAIQRPGSDGSPSLKPGEDTQLLGMGMQPDLN